LLWLEALAGWAAPSSRPWSPRGSTRHSSCLERYADLVNYTLVISNLLLQTSETKAKEIGAPILAVDYNDINALTAVLETNKVEVVISTLDANAGAGPEFGLIQAADRSSATRRYIPNNWGIKPTEQYVPVPKPY
jgi:hypothetical protein